jgi:hypothetical protein
MKRTRAGVLGSLPAVPRLARETGGNPRGKSSRVSQPPRYSSGVRKGRSHLPCRAPTANRTSWDRTELAGLRAKIPPAEQFQSHAFTGAMPGCSCLTPRSAPNPWIGNFRFDLELLSTY